MLGFNTRTVGFALLLCVCVATSAFAQGRIHADRVIAFGDVHGAFKELTALLMDVGLVDEQLTWRGGTTHLVSLGDLMDRGPDARLVLDLLRRLQGEAAAAGGRVHVLLGNHELMSLTGDARYVSAAERQSFKSLAPAAKSELGGWRAAYRPDGLYGAWLLEQSVTVVINDTVFVHGGLAPVIAELGPAGVNARTREVLTELLALRDTLVEAGALPAEQDTHEAAAYLTETKPSDPAVAESARRFVELTAHPLLGDEGPMWYRGNSFCHPLLETPALKGVLEAWGADRVVVGHTPTPDHRVRYRLDGLVVLADTGMLSSHYGGRGSAVILDGGDISVHYRGATRLQRPVEHDGTPLAPLEEAMVLSALNTLTAPADTAWQRIEITPQVAIAARTLPAGRRARRAELAALKLDRMLGLNLVVPTTAGADDADSSMLAAAWPNVITERQRQAAGLAGPPECAGGNALDLIYTFDALIGNGGRSADTLLYDPQTWRVGSVNHAHSFGRSRRLPAYLDQAPRRLPSALADRLATLTESELQAALGTLLGRAQIRGLLARRDRLLSRWETGD